MIYEKFEQHALNLKNHYLFKKSNKTLKKMKEKIKKETKLWSNSDVLLDKNIIHYSIKPTKWGGYMFGKLNKSKLKYVMDELGYNDITELPSAQKFLDKYVADDELSFFNWKDYTFFKCKKSYFTELTKENHYVAEWIRTNRPRRLYIDIDGKDILEDVVKKLNETFTIDGRPPKICISGSKGYKYRKGTFTEDRYLSYHIVLPEFYFPNVQSMRYFKNWVGFIGGDSRIYIRNSKFKCINQKKNKDGDDRLQKIIENSTPDNHRVQLLLSETDSLIDLSTDEWSKIFMKDFHEKVISNSTKIVSKRSNRGRRVGFKDIKAIDVDLEDIPTLSIKYDSALDILMKFQWRKGYRLPPQVWRNIVRWFARGEGGTYEEFQKWDREFCRYWTGEETTRKQFEDIYNVPKENWHWYGRWMIKEYLVKHYGVELEETYLKNFRDQFIKRDETYKGIRPTVVNEKYIMLNYINDAKFQLLCVSMGAGKTELAMRFLQQMIMKNPEKKFCFITTRISQASGVIGRSCEKCLDVYLYSDAGKEKHVRLKYEPRLCIEIESLHHVLNSHFDYIILDEMESIRESFKNKTCHRHNYTKNYTAFTKLIKNAKKVFVMDAYLHKWTIDWLQLVDTEAHPVDDFNLIMRHKNYDIIQKQVFIEKSFYVMIKKIIEDLKAGKKIYVLYPYATGTRKTYGRANKKDDDGKDKKKEDYSINEKENILSFTEYLLEQAELKRCQGLTYFGALAKKDKDKLSAVNNTWTKTDSGDLIKLIVVNTAVTVGVNYDLEKPSNPDDFDHRFDKVYLFYTDLISARQCIQSSMRPRHTKTPIIHLYEFPNYEIINCIKKKKHYCPKQIERPTLIGDEPSHFTHMADCIETEHKANGLTTLKHYMTMTGYKINRGVDNDNKKFAEYCKKIYIETQVEREDVNDFSYANAKTITSEEYDKLEVKVYEGTSTFEENLSIRKYKIQRHFQAEYSEAAGVFWEKKHILDSFLILLDKCTYSDDFIDDIPLHEVDVNTLWNDVEHTVAKEEFIKREKRMIKNIYEKAVYYDEVENDFKIKTDKLTKEDKKEIHNCFFLPNPDKDFTYFTNRTDNVIRKRILNFMFGKNATENIRTTKSIEFTENFREMYIKSLEGLKKIKKTEIKNHFKQGICRIDEDTYEKWKKQYPELHRRVMNREMNINDVPEEFEFIHELRTEYNYRQSGSILGYTKSEGKQ